MHFKQNNKESKTYVQGLRAFGRTLTPSVRKILKKNGYNYSEIINKWNLLVGESISKQCYPKSIKMDHKGDGGTIELLVERGNEINIEYSKNEIINKINSYFGYNLINKIRLQTFNMAKKKEKTKNVDKKFSEKFEKKINEIENENLKKSLSQLLSVIKNV